GGNDRRPAAVHASPSADRIGPWSLAGSEGNRWPRLDDDRRVHSPTSGSTRPHAPSSASRSPGQLACYGRTNGVAHARALVRRSASPPPRSSTASARSTTAIDARYATDPERKISRADAYVPPSRVSTTYCASS